jgi:hypothetical protein
VIPPGEFENSESNSSGNFSLSSEDRFTTCIPNCHTRTRIFPACAGARARSWICQIEAFARTVWRH